MRRSPKACLARSLRSTATVAAVVLLAVAAMHALTVAAHAQGNPFGAGPRPSAPPMGGVVGWILERQAHYYAQFNATIKAAKADGSALWTLASLSFFYGIFHAAGPGHGKAVISSYLVANNETWRRGVVLSFASALVQALTAIAVVGVAAVLLGATAKAMGDTVRWIEVASYLLIIGLGARLLWTKGRGFFAALRAQPSAPALVPVGAAAGGGHAMASDHHHDHIHHDHAHERRALGAADAHDHSHAHHDHAHHHHHHVHDENCGCAHGPDPEILAGRGGWRRGLSAVIGVGLRPCSGAILVLVFAMAQGLFWAGVASTLLMGLGTAITVTAIATLAVSAKDVAARLAATRSGGGMLVMRGLEVAAAALVLCFGVLLL
ncbi:MAG: nickel/cobalt transporter, partial [Rhizobiales bacterium]|nr:nickel/cobalt transporter [Hyphomicrobiales bacterium]